MQLKAQRWTSGEVCSRRSGSLTKNPILCSLLWRWHPPGDLSSSRLFSHVSKTAAGVLHSHPLPTEVSSRVPT